MNKTCPCGSQKALAQCCMPYITNHSAPTAEVLMRSRYTAFTLHLADYLFQTTSLAERRFTSKREILEWAQQNTWLKLEVLASTAQTVTFKAYFLDAKGQAQVHHEKSTFKEVHGKWYYVKGKLEP
ncbi:YchJ family protein [Flavobacterium sp.]|uniref:YchJ family protein n=1 Tax=Flavobacterium sp. TaxID=239 RepID=UPI0037BF260D